MPETLGPRWKGDDWWWDARAWWEAAVYMGRKARLAVAAGDQATAKECARYAARYYRFREACQEAGAGRPWDRG